MKKRKTQEKKRGGIMMKGTRIMKPKKGKGSYDRKAANQVGRGSSPSHAGLLLGYFF